MRKRQVLTMLGITVGVGAFGLAADAGQTFLGSSGHVQSGATASFSADEYDGYTTLDGRLGGGILGTNAYIVPMTVAYSSGTQTVIGKVQVSYPAGTCYDPGEDYVQLFSTDSSGYYSWVSAKNTEASITIPPQGGLFAKVGICYGVVTKVIGAYWR